MLDVKKDFPLLVNNSVTFLDSAASSQKPKMVIEGLEHFYTHLNANVHRGTYQLSVAATEAYEEARRKLATLIGADEREIIFVRNATEALNLIAYAWGLRNLKAGDEILLTEMEHHANLVPWHLVTNYTGASIKAVPITSEGRLDVDSFETLLTDKVKIVSVVHMSNVLGTVNPVREIAKLAKSKGALFVVDGAQSVPHMPVNVKELGADFLAFSGHKMCGPTGVGVLWGRFDILKDMQPFLGGGEMISKVFIDHSTYADPPQRFEAGTPPIAEAIALGAAADYLTTIGMSAIWQHDHELVTYALNRLDEEVPEVRTFGPRGPDRGGIIAFTLGNLHAHDLATALDERGIAVRAGHHCAQPLHRKLNVPATARASFYLYTTQKDVDHFIETLKKVRTFFKAWLY
jgi:cysteine desulfurase / selenocysteine lyase